MTASTGVEIVRRYYGDFWNHGDLASAAAFIAAGAVFRTSKAVTARNRNELLRYAQTVRLGFPDIRHDIDELTGHGDWVTAKVTVTGTHRGRMLGVAPTGRRVHYGLTAKFRIVGGKIVEGCTDDDAGEISGQLQGKPAGEIGKAPKVPLSIRWREWLRGLSR